MFAGVHGTVRHRDRPRGFRMTHMAQPRRLALVLAALLTTAAPVLVQPPAAVAAPPPVLREKSGDNAYQRYLEVLKKWTQQPVVRSELAVYTNRERPNEYPAEPDGLTGIAEYSYDYKNRQLSYNQNGEYLKQPDGTCYTKLFTRDTEWKQRDEGTCFYKGRYKISDGLIPGGLTREQSDKFVGYLNKTKFITVHEVRSVERNGKKYDRYIADYGPVKTSMGYYGLITFDHAFKQTGLDQEDHVYGTIGAIGQGMRVVLYVDPDKNLPVYEELEDTPIRDQDGNPRKMEAYRLRQIELWFGDKATSYDVKTTGKPQIDWPREED